MNFENKCERLAQRIHEIFRQGLPLSTDALHYIDSTFGNPSPAQLDDILHDESNCERDPLVELIFFPDESIQTQLESVLEHGDFQKEDEQKILDHLLLHPAEITLRFSDGRGTLNVTVSVAAARQFIDRLNVSKKLDQRIVDVLHGLAGVKLITLVKVKLRNARFAFTEGRVRFLRSFFEKMKADAGDFLECLEFILRFFEEQKTEKDLYESLMEKKQFYLRHLQKAERLHEQLEKNNLETLILQGVRIPYFDKTDALKNLKIIDAISLAVFDKIDYSGQEQELMVFGEFEQDPEAGNGR